MKSDKEKADILANMLQRRVESCFIRQHLQVNYPKQWQQHMCMFRMAPECDYDIVMRKVAGRILLQVTNGAKL